MFPSLRIIGVASWQVVHALQVYEANYSSVITLCIFTSLNKRPFFELGLVFTVNSELALPYPTARERATEGCFANFVKYVFFPPVSPQMCKQITSSTRKKHLSETLTPFIQDTTIAAFERPLLTTLSNEGKMPCYWLPATGYIPQ